jgi:cellulose synthase/poly-beta-1,6-N-acetylglucosamine synthase-like glycosyltransferase
LDTVFTILFWTSLAGLALSYLGYPALLYLLSRYVVLDRRVQVEPADGELPEVTVLIAAHNAECHIVDRVDNILACDYPRHRLRIVVASDGSTDATVERVKRMGYANVRAIDFAQRRGKADTLVSAVRQVHSEVVLFTDASTVFEADSIRQLARHFIDPDVGLATGKVAIVDAEGRPSESLYWRIEMMLRRVEARLGIMLGASGAIYAIRRRLLVEPKCPVINDDLVLPMLVSLRHRCRFVFDESARAYALGGGGLAGEFRRRSRIGAGAFQCLPVLGELLRWRHAKVASAFACHKLLRWVGPFLMVTLLISNVALLSAPGYRIWMTVQTASYLIALVGFVLPRRGRATDAARMASSFLLMNLALLAGFFRWASQPGNVLWSPTRRPAVNLKLVSAQQLLDGRIEQDELAA